MMIGAILFLAALKIQILEFFYARVETSNGGASESIPIVLSKMFRRSTA